MTLPFTLSPSRLASNKFALHQKPAIPCAAFIHASILMTLAMGIIHPVSAWADAPPALTGIECLNDLSQSTEWFTSLNIEVQLQGVTGEPLWVDIDEDPMFGSPTTLDFTDPLPELIRTFSGHDDGLFSVAFSPDGSQVLTGSRDGTARLWDARTGDEIQLFDVNSWVISVAFSPDGTQILTGSFGGKRTLWDIETGQEIMTYGGRQGSVQAVAFSPDGTQVLTANINNYARLWDARTGELIHTFTHTGVFNGVRSVAFSPDGSQVLTGSPDSTARLWNARTGEEIRVFTHPDWVFSVAFSPDGTKIVTGNNDDIGRIWDAQTGEIIHTLTGHAGNVYSGAFSPDGTQVVTAGSEDGMLMFWDVQSGMRIRTIDTQTNYVSQVAYSPDGQQVLSADGDNTARIRSLNSRFSYTLDSGDDGLRTVYVRLRNDSGQSKVVSDTLTLAINAPTGAIVINNGDDFTGSPDVTLTLDATDKTGSGITHMRLSPDGETWGEWVDFSESADWTLPPGDGPQTVHVQFRDALGNVSLTYQDMIELDTQPPSAPGRPVTAEGDWSFNPVIFSWAASTDDGSGVSSYQYQIGTTPGQNDIDDNNVVDETTIILNNAFLIGKPVYLRVRAIDKVGNVSPWTDSGGILVSDDTAPQISGIDLLSAITMQGDETIARELVINLKGIYHTPLWIDIDEDPDFGSPVTLDDPRHFTPLIRDFSTETGGVNSVAFSPDGSRILTTSDDGLPLMWNAQTGELIRTMTGYTRDFFSVVFSPDGSQILAGGWSFDAHLWNAQTGAEIRFFDYQDMIRSVDFSADGSQVLMGGDDNAAHIWDIMEDDPIMSFVGHSDKVTEVAFSPTGSQVFTCSIDGTVKMYDRHSGNLIRTFTDPSSSYFQCLAINPDGSRVLAGNGQGNLYIWNTWSGQLIQTFHGHSESVYACTFSPDGTMVLSGSRDKTARLWRVESGEEINLFPHRSFVNSVAFSPDGEQLLMGCQDRITRLFKLDASVDYTLDPGANGSRTVYVRLRNHAGQSAVVSDSIILNNSNGVSDWMLYR